MYYALRTIGYFVTWGTFYGFLLGVWATTVMFPVLGTLMGALWGPGIGAACGLLCGILVAIIQHFTFHEESDLTRYQRWMSRGMGLLAALAAPIALVMTSGNVLWPIFGTGSVMAEQFLIPSLLSVIFWGGLSSAYVAHSYVPWLANLKITQAHQNVRPALKTPFRSAWVITRDTLVTALAAYMPARWLARIRLHETEATAALTRRWQLPSMTLAMAREMFRIPLLITTIYTIVSLMIFDPGANAVWAGTFATLVTALILAIGNSALMVFIRRLFLNDDDTSPLYARRVLTVSTVSLMIACVLYYVVAGAGADILPLLIPWPFLVGWASWHAFPHFNLMTEKAKRKEKGASDKPKNTLALDEESDDPDVYESEAEAPAQEQQR